MRTVRLFVLIACATPAFAQWGCLIGETPIACQQRVADQQAADEKAYREAVQKKAEMNRDIAAARARFWATYPDKPGFQAARDKFVEMLHQKDIYFLILIYSSSEMQNSVPEAPKGSVAELLDRYVGGTQLDNGISRTSLQEFQDWVDAFGQHLKGIRTLRLGARLGEFDLVTRIPVGYEVPRNYTAMLYFRFGHVPQQAGFDIVASMIKVLSNDAVESAANQVKSAPKEHDGTLQVTFPLPVKTGPGGNKLQDDTVPMPSNVIGFYVGQLKAFEALATRGDDHRYLLDLIAANTSTPGQKNFHIGKWDRAAKTYDRYAWAFGQRAVLEVTHKVRLAVKRASDFGVMDAQALGSTRTAPYSAFEDLLARKDPRGYIRSMLTFERNANSKADVDAAYREFIAGANEDTVIATAAKLAANRPELASDFDLLTKARNGSISVEKTVATLVDDWQFISWKGFSPGAQSTYITRALVPEMRGSANLVPGQVGNRATFKLQSITQDQARLWLTEIAYDYPTFRPGPPHDTETAFSSKRPAPRPPQRAPVVETGEETQVIGKQFPRAGNRSPPLMAPVQ